MSIRRADIEELRAAARRVAAIAEDYSSEYTSMYSVIEDNLRYVIRKGAKLAHKDLSDEDEDKIMEIIKERGVSPDLLNLI